MNDFKPSFDYEWLGKCEFPTGRDGPSIGASCGDPAIVRVWWEDYETGQMLLCPYHWEVIKRQEE